MYIFRSMEKIMLNAFARAQYRQVRVLAQVYSIVDVYARLRYEYMQNVRVCTRGALLCSEYNRRYADNWVTSSSSARALEGRRDKWCIGESVRFPR